MKCTPSASSGEQWGVLTLVVTKWLVSYMCELQLRILYLLNSWSKRPETLCESVPVAKVIYHVTLWVDASCWNELCFELLCGTASAMNGRIRSHVWLKCWVRHLMWFIYYFVMNCVLLFVLLAHLCFVCVWLQYLYFYVEAYVR